MEPFNCKCITHITSIRITDQSFKALYASSISKYRIIISSHNTFKDYNEFITKQLRISLGNIHIFRYEILDIAGEKFSINRS